MFAGMIGVTIFGLMFTPAFYTFIRNFGSEQKSTTVQEATEHNSETPS